ncbi:hypothetical protein GCM10009647_080060 [Streptomyces sanglieri]
MADEARTQHTLALPIGDQRHGEVGRTGIVVWPRRRFDRKLNDWYAKMGQFIQEFEDKYESVDESAVAAES